MTDKSKFDRKTPSAGFMRFILLWSWWSVWIGLITIGTLVTIANRTLSSDTQPMPVWVAILGVLVAGVGIYWVSRWQYNTLHKKTGREFKHWALWSALSWIVGMMTALLVTQQLLVRSGYDVVASVAVMAGLGLFIIYGLMGACHGWLLRRHLDFAFPYTFVMVAGVLFWVLFIGDPRRIALGGLLAPALQGLASGIILMWLFHLAKLGNIAMKSKHETAEDVT